MDSTQLKAANGVWRFGAGGAGAARRVPAIVVLVVAMGLSLLPASSSQAAHSTWVVDADAVLPAAARVIGELPLIDSLIVSSPTAIPGAVSAETGLSPQSAVGVEAESSEQATVDPVSAAEAIGASVAWAEGYEGRQAVVALVDTGVAPVDALAGAVAGEIDFSGTGTGGDGYGHGTFMASAIAGRVAGANTASGVAPEAGIMSLKVADAEGDATLGSVLGALQWLHGPGATAGIRIAALALAVDQDEEGALLLEQAVDALAERGVLVITASGNETELTSPASSVTTLSVGATDGDGNVAGFSGHGVDRAGVMQPDVTARGVRVLGSLPGDSWLVNNGALPTEDGLYTGTGTSMSTAIAAGVAALASDARPDLAGPLLAEAMTTGDPGAPLDLAATLTALDGIAATGPGRGHANGNNGQGHGDNAGGANGNGPGVNNGNGRGNGNGNGEVADPQSIRWTSIRWTSIRWTSIRWTSIRWTGAGWGDSSWADSAWGGGDWGSIRWTGETWESTEVWPQSIRWTSIRWTGLS